MDRVARTAKESPVMHKLDLAVTPVSVVSLKGPLIIIRGKG